MAKGYEDPFCERALDRMNEAPVELVGVPEAMQQGASVKARRDRGLDIVIEITSPGWHDRQAPEATLGEVKRPEAELRFRSLLGGEATAHAVDWSGRRQRETGPQSAETTEIFSAHALSWRFEGAARPAYLVEWVLNLPSNRLWPALNRIEATKTFERTLGEGLAEFRMNRTGRTLSHGRALHTRIDGMEIYLFESAEDPERNSGQIVFRGVPDQEVRDRIRACLSFALGKPLVYLGHTAFAADWTHTEMRAVSAFSNRGAFFELHDQPPYPLHAYGRNLVDPERFNRTVNALYRQFDALHFRSLSWSYWYAACAPFHSQAVHLGGLIEKLQKDLADHIPKSTLIDATLGGDLQKLVNEWIAAANLDNKAREILKSRAANLNTAPQSVLLTRLVEAFGLEVAAPEKNAWRERNRAAHGGVPNDAVDAILGNKLLKILFHRLVAGVTGCANQYIDYYNLEHPFRPLRQAVPKR